MTRWTKLDTEWRGVSLDTLLEDVETAADFALVHSYGGYTTNLPLEDLLDGQAWVAFEYDGDDLRPGARRPGPAAGAAPLLLEVGQVGARPRPDAPGRARLLGAARLPRLRRPMARAAVPGGLSARRAWRPAALVERRTETPSAAHPRPRRRRLAGPPARPARRRTPHRRRRLHRDAQLLRSPRRPTATASRSRSSASPDGEVSPFLADELAVGDAVEAAGPARRLVRLAPDAARPGAARRRRLRHRAADGDDPGPRRGVSRAAVPARLLGAHARGRDLPRRAAPRSRPGRRPRRRLVLHPRAPDGERPAARAGSVPTTSSRTGGRRLRADLLRLRPDGLRRGRGRPARRRATTRTASGPSDSGRAAREEASCHDEHDRRASADWDGNLWPARCPRCSPST